MHLYFIKVKIWNLILLMCVRRGGIMQVSLIIQNMTVTLCHNFMHYEEPDILIYTAMKYVKGNIWSSLLYAPLQV